MLVEKMGKGKEGFSGGCGGESITHMKRRKAGKKKTRTKIGRWQEKKDPGLGMQEGRSSKASE